MLIKNCIGWETNFFLINSTILLIRLTHRNAYMYKYLCCTLLIPISSYYSIEAIVCLLSLLEKKMDWTEFHMSSFYCKMKEKIFKSLFSHLIYRFMDLILSACDSSEIRGFMLTEIVQAKLLQNLTYILFWEYKKTQKVFLHFWILDIEHKPIISEVWCAVY